MMEETKSKVDELFEDVGEYIDTRTELVTLKTTEKIAEGISVTISNILIGILFLLCFLFMSLALAWYLSAVLGRPHLGFVIVGGIYLLMGLFLWAGKDKLLQKPLMNMIIKQLFNERNEDEN